MEKQQKTLQSQFQCLHPHAFKNRLQASQKKITYQWFVHKLGVAPSEHGSHLDGMLLSTLI